MSAALALPMTFLPPSVPAPEVWLSADRVLTMCGWSARWLRHLVATGGVQARETEAKLPNGRFAMEYLLSSLPAQAQQRYQAEQAKLALPVQPSLPLFNAPQLVRATPRVRLAPAQTTEAERRDEILKKIRDMEDPYARRVYALDPNHRLLNGKPVDSKTRMIQYQAERSALNGDPVSTRTIRRWLKARKDGGIAALARRKRADAGSSQYFKRPENVRGAWLLAHLYLGDGIHPGLSVKACYRMLQLQCSLVGIADADLPHYNTVRNLLDKVTPALKSYARKGREEFAAAMLPYISRGYTEYANAWWLSDHMIFDVEVMNDCVPGAPIGEPVRLRLTAIIDYRSRFVTGFSICWEGSSDSIASAMRMAVLTHGPCENFYCDNGKDYLKVGKGAVPGYMQPGSVEADEWALRELARIDQTGICFRIGMQVTNCLVRHPQSKHVERFFRRVHEEYCKLWPTYTAGKPSLRPDNTAALMAVHRKAMRRKDLTQSHHPLASDFIRAFENWLEIYHNTPDHEGQGMDGRSPRQVFEQERNPNQRPAPTAADLAPLLWEHTTRTVSECQIVLNGIEYAPYEDGYAAQVMLDLTGKKKKVTIAYDRLDPSEIAVLDAENRVLTMLPAKRLARQAPDDPETKLQIQQMTQMRGAMVRSLKGRLTTITKGAKQIGVIHPVDLLGAMSPSASPETRITPRKPSADIATTHRARMYPNEIAAQIMARRQGVK
jgi:hypothetical protein